MVAEIVRGQVTHIHLRSSIWTSTMMTGPHVDQASIRTSPDGKMQATVIQPQRHVRSLPPCGHEAPPYFSARSQLVRIGNCDVRRGRTSPPDDCAQTSVTWRRTQSSITKYVLDTEGTSSRTDSRENSFPSYLSKAGGEIHHQVKCVPRHTCVIWSHTPQAPNLIP